MNIIILMVYRTPTGGLPPHYSWSADSPLKLLTDLFKLDAFWEYPPPPSVLQAPIQHPPHPLLFFPSRW